MNVRYARILVTIAHLSKDLNCRCLSRLLDTKDVLPQTIQIFLDATMKDIVD